MIIPSDETFCTQSQIMVEKFLNFQQNLSTLARGWPLPNDMPYFMFDYIIINNLHDLVHVVAVLFVIIYLHL